MLGTQSALAARRGRPRIMGGGGGGGRVGLVHFSCLGFRELRC